MRSRPNLLPIQRPAFTNLVGMLSIRFEVNCKNPITPVKQPTVVLFSSSTFTKPPLDNKPYIFNHHSINFDSTDIFPPLGILLCQLFPPVHGNHCIFLSGHEGFDFGFGRHLLAGQLNVSFYTLTRWWSIGNSKKTYMRVRLHRFKRF